MSATVAAARKILVTIRARRRRGRTIKDCGLGAVVVEGVLPLGSIAAVEVEGVWIREYSHILFLSCRMRIIRGVEMLLLVLVLVLVLGRAFRAVAVVLVVGDEWVVEIEVVGVELMSGKGRMGAIWVGLLGEVEAVGVGRLIIRGRGGVVDKKRRKIESFQAWEQWAR